MEALSSRLPEADALAVTGLRDVRTATESWPAEEGPESDLPVPQGELLAGRYLVERIFAEGGMGIVCLGRHAQLEQPVAIKFLRRALAGRPEVVQRFLNEARALAALRSEHVVRVMDVGQLDSGRPYLVMEHLEGIDLDALVDRDGPLPIETAVSYALQVCEPLAEAHALGIVHRDIKPENLFLWSGGPAKDLIKVLDFGLAKQFGSPRAMVTGPQDSMGSPCYMSPEQVTTPQSIDSRTDIWSLGVVLHRMLTDTLPFDGNSILEVLSHVLSAEPKSLSEARPDLDFDAELESIVRRCLAKTPAARYQSMAELSEALSEYLAQRQAALAPPAPESLPVAQGAHVLAGDEEKIRIAGLHSRWPGVLLVGLALAGAAVYQADRTHKINVRDLTMRARDVTDGWLTPVRLGPDVQPSSRESGSYQPTLRVARGVFAAHPTRDASGALALRAVPELESDSESDNGAESATTPLTDTERARKQAAYRDYLKSEGLTPINEALPSPDEPYAD